TLSESDTSTPSSRTLRPTYASKGRGTWVTPGASSGRRYTRRPRARPATGLLRATTNSEVPASGHSTVLTSPLRRQELPTISASTPASAGSPEHTAFQTTATPAVGDDTP